MAAASGIVTFAGLVAGRGVVVIQHAGGIRTEYEPVTPAVHRGGRVSRGASFGTIDGRHPGCPVPSCLHWGARRGQTYFDPLTLLRPLGPVRLLPWLNR
ncbi:MAG: M23 family metallopeptidase [Actinomycetota bacterium]|nr:M23 family metallopeptidase [Actinomycetota bacterium]